MKVIIDRVIGRLSAVLLAISCLLAACGGSSRHDNRVFRYNEASGIATLDPAMAKNQSIMWAIHQVYNTLVETDQQLRISPSLAYRWEVSPDRLLYTFHLRPDVYFHDDACFNNSRGRKLVASDVVYSFQRIINPLTASSGAWIFNNRVDSLMPFTAIDDSTFQLKLRQPFTPVLGLLSMQYCSIVPKEAVDRYGADFRRHPVGTGPFSFSAWEEGQALVMLKNKRYFEKDSAGISLPYLDAVKVSFYDSKATEFLLFRQQQLDFINDIDASFRDEVLTKKGVLKKEWNNKITLSKHPYLNTEYLGILVDSNNQLVKDSPLRLKKIRQAINYGFDRDKMILYLRNSIGIPANAGFIPAGLPGYDSNSVTGYRYNPGKAAELLREAGFPNGSGMPPIKLLTIPIYADLGSYIARQLEEIGIPVQVETVQKSLLLEQTSTSRASFFRGSWIADYPEAENYLSVFYGKNPAPPNYTRYNNPIFDKLYEQALLVNDDSARIELYKQMDRIIIEDAPVVPLWYDEVIRLVQPNVKGFEPNGLNLLELRRVKKVEGPGS